MAVVEGLQNMARGAISIPATLTDIVVDLTTRELALRVLSVTWGYVPYDLQTDPEDAAFTCSGHYFIIRGFNPSDYNASFNNFTVSPAPIFEANGREVPDYDATYGYGSHTIVYDSTDPLIIPAQTKAMAVVARPFFPPTQDHKTESFLLVRTRNATPEEAEWFGRKVQY